MSESNGYATPDQLFGQPVKRRFIDVEINGHKFRLKSLNSTEAAKFARESESRNGSLSVNSRLIVLMCVDANGDAMFTSEHIKQWQQQDARFVASLARACIEHAGLTEFDEEAAKN